MFLTNGSGSLHFLFSVTFFFYCLFFWCNAGILSLLIVMFHEAGKVDGDVVVDLALYFVIGFSNSFDKLLFELFY